MHGVQKVWPVESGERRVESGERRVESELRRLASAPSLHSPLSTLHSLTPSVLLPFFYRSFTVLLEFQKNGKRNVKEMQKKCRSQQGVFPLPAPPRRRGRRTAVQNFFAPTRPMSNFSCIFAILTTPPSRDRTIINNTNIMHSNTACYPPPLRTRTQLRRCRLF